MSGIQRKENRKRKLAHLIDSLGSSDAQIEVNVTKQTSESHSTTIDMKKTQKQLLRIEKKKRKIVEFLSSTEEIIGPGGISLNVTNSNSFSDLRKQLIVTKKSQQRPKFVLLNKLVAHVDEKLENSKQSSDIRISASDLQMLLVGCFLENSKMSYKPSWCEISHPESSFKTCVFILDCETPLALNEYDRSLFQHVIKFEKSAKLLDTLLNVPLSKNQLSRGFGNYKFIPDKTEVKQEEKPSDQEIESKENVKFEKASKTKLLLSPMQMLAEGCPLPDNEMYVNFICSKSKYDPANDDSPLYAIDCEMCLTVYNESQIARVSIIDEQENVVLDEFVKPKHRIRDYLTRFSGVTKEMMETATLTVEDIQKKIEKLLPSDAILCGQSICNDLRALQIIHPYVIDTSVIYNLSGIRQCKTGLKALAARFLEHDIQAGVDGHCSVEDSIATLRLVKLKLSQTLDFGDNVLSAGKYGISKEVQYSLPFASYCLTKDVKMNVFYDYVDPTCDRFISVYSNCDKNVVDAIRNCVTSSDRVIAVVVSGDGLCYIRA